MVDKKKAVSPVRPQPQRGPVRGQTKGISRSRVDTGLRKTVKEPVPTMAEKRAAIREKENTFIKPAAKVCEVFILKTLPSFIKVNKNVIVN